jgi:hypothetical protein
VDILGTLPVWMQVVIALLVAAVLVFMNIGWLIQARGWLERQGQRRPGGPAAPGASGTTPARSQRDRA